MVWPQVLSLLSVVSAVSAQGWQNWQQAPADYTPDYVLVATAQNITINCISRYSVVFNGTSPGPPLYLKEGETTWVRVYNEIPDQNVTVVSSSAHFFDKAKKLSIGMV